MNSRRQALLFGVSGQVAGLLTRLQVCNETGGTSGGGTSHAVNFDKSTAMEREQRAIDAMRARRQAELDQMVRFRHLLCILLVIVTKLRTLQQMFACCSGVRCVNACNCGCRLRTR